MGGGEVSFKRINERSLTMSDEIKNDGIKCYEGFVAKTDVKKHYGWILDYANGLRDNITEADLMSLHKIIDLFCELSEYEANALCQDFLEREECTMYEVKSFEEWLLKVGKSCYESWQDMTNGEVGKKNTEMIEEDMDKLGKEQELLISLARCRTPTIEYDKSDPITRLDIKEAIEKVEEALAELSKYKTVLDDGTVKTIKP